LKEEYGGLNREETVTKQFVVLFILLYNYCLEEMLRDGVSSPHIYI